MKIKKILLPVFIILFLFFLKTDLVLKAYACPPDPTLTLTGSQVLKPGEFTTFSYNTYGWNAYACIMNGGYMGGSGNRMIWPSEDTTYRIDCSQEGCTHEHCYDEELGEECECDRWGTCEASSASYNIKVLTVKLEGSDVMHYAEYSGSDLTTLKWQASSGFDSCTASSNPAGSWSGSKSLSGSQDVAINQNTTFTLTCTRNSNPSYTNSASVTVLYISSRCTDRAGCISVTPASRQGAGPVTVNWTLNQAPDTYRVFYIEEGSDNIIHPIIGNQSSGVPYSGSSSGSQTVNISKTTYFFLEMDKGSEHSCEDTGGGGGDDCCIGWLVNRTAGYVQLTGNNGRVYGLQSYGVWAGYRYISELKNYSSSGSTYTGCAYGTGGYGGGPGGSIATKVYSSCDLGLDGRPVCTVNCIDTPGWHAVEWAKAEVTSAPTACSCTATATPNPIPPGHSTTTIDVDAINSHHIGTCTTLENYGLPYTFTQTEDSKTYTVRCSGESSEYAGCTCTVTVKKEKGKCDCSNFTCSPSGTGPGCATDDDCTCSACWGSRGYACTTETNCQAGSDKGSDNCLSGQTCCIPTKYACETTQNTWRCFSSPSGSYETEEACEAECGPCKIINFEFNPSKIFLSQKTNASWTTEGQCTTCNGSTTPACDLEYAWRKDLPLSSVSPVAVKPSVSGICQYTLTCQGKWSDTVSQTVSVEVYKAPIWREVAPKLGGYLWGIVFGK